MRCPECDGTGRILLFVSARECGTCKGTGEVEGEPSETSSDDPPKTKGKLEVRGIIEGEDAFVVEGGTGSSGGITITSGDSTGSGWGGDITITGGISIPQNTGGLWVDTSSPTLNFTDNSAGSWNCQEQFGSLQLQSSTNGPTCHFITGNTKPSEQPLAAPMGSLFMCDDGSGSLWVKTGPGNDEWERIATGSAPTARASTTDPYRSATRYVWGEDQEPFTRAQVVAYVAEVIERHKGLETKVRSGEICMDSFHEMLGELPLQDYTIPVVAPISTDIIADMMAIVEQSGHELVAFVSSCRDFADLRKWPQGTPGYAWDGGELTYFNAPVWRSSEVPPGYVAAVGTDKKIVLALVTR